MTFVARLRGRSLEFALRVRLCQECVASSLQGGCVPDIVSRSPLLAAATTDENRVGFRLSSL